MRQRKCLWTLEEYISWYFLKDKTCPLLTEVLTFMRNPRLLSLKTSLRNTMSSLWLASGRSWDVSRASVSWSPTEETGGGELESCARAWTDGAASFEQPGQYVLRSYTLYLSICASSHSPAPAERTGMASYMGQWGQERNLERDRGDKLTLSKQIICFHYESQLES